jgi:M6 family metalloprotease-like protein
MYKNLFLTILPITSISILAINFVVPGSDQPAASTSRGLSVVALQPDASEAIRAQGKPFHYPFMHKPNNGRKFNPTDGTVPPLFPIAPEQKVIVLFAEFENLPPGGPATRLNLNYFDDMLFGKVYDPSEYADYPHPTDRTLYNYYQEVSYGTVHITTQNLPSTTGWVNVGKPYEYYVQLNGNGVCNNGEGPYPNNAARMVVDAAKAADPTVDFSQYAVDGEVPNLFVVYAGTGAEWSGDPCLFWSHSWNLVDAGVAEADRTVDGVKINHYAVMPEVGGDLTNYRHGEGEVPRGPFPPTVGVYAHEYGHVLGLPDQYDYGFESDGTGEYSLMARGNWNRSSSEPLFSGDSPAHLDAWSKYMLGWVTPIEIKESDPSTQYILPPAEQNPVAYKMIVPDSGGKEYFLFENRQGIGFDQGLERFGTHGLAIYHVDETVFDRNYNYPNEAENWKEFRSEGWRKARTGETHYAISLVQADDRWDLEHGVYTSTSLAGDLYPGLLQKTEFGNYTAPNSSTYYFWGSNKEPKFGYSGITVTGIQESGSYITATFDFVPWKPIKK